MVVSGATLTTSLVCALVILSMAPIYPAWPLTARLWSDWTREARPPCRPDWDRFRHICWLPVPGSVTSLDGDAQADLYCKQLDTRTFNLHGLYICVEDARQSDGRETDELLRRDLSNRRKRLMGNNGY